MIEKAEIDVSHRAGGAGSIYRRGRLRKLAAQRYQAKLGVGGEPELRERDPGRCAVCKGMIAWVPSSLEDRKLRSTSLVQIPGNDVLHPCPGLAEFAPTTTVPRLFSFTCSSEPTTRLTRGFRQTSRAFLAFGNSAVVDRMGKHQLHWHIRKPQYGSRRLAAKNHFVAALGEVSWSG